MHNQLRQLARLAEARGSRFSFNPPLTPAMIQAKLAAHGLPCCDEIIQLYAWANGTDYATSDALFRDSVFLPLDEAMDLQLLLAAWRGEFDIRGLDLSRAVPFAKTYGRAIFLFYAGDIGLLRHPILTVGDTLAIEYKNLQALLDTCVAWHEMTEPEAEPRDLAGPTWLAHNTVGGDPHYIDRLHAGARWAGVVE